MTVAFVPTGMNWGVSSEQFMAIISMDAWGTFGRLSLLAVGLYLAALIVRGDERAPRYVVRYGFACVAFEALLNGAQLQLWGIPRGMTAAAYASRFGSYAAAMIAWVVYVSRSNAMRAAFTRTPRAVGPIGRQLIGLSAIVGIAWPFALNLVVDPTSALAGRISPKELTVGSGFADGLLAMSVACGLFVLMKHAQRLSNVWVAVLLPVCFAALALVYGWQGFMLHWTF